MISEELMGILRCPYCRGLLELRGDVIICRGCSRVYVFRHGFPDFRIPECFCGMNIIQRAFYNLYAPLYDKWEQRFALRRGFTEEMLREKIVSEMAIEDGDMVLEICIGTGSNIPYYRRYTRNTIVGLDISEGMMLKAVEKARKYGNVELVLGCAEYLPFRDNCFEKILIGGAISYFKKPAKALEEAYRVLKRGGRLVIYDQLSTIDRLLGKQSYQ